MNYTSPFIVSIFFYLLVIQTSVFVAAVAAAAAAAADSSRAPITTDSPRNTLRRSATSRDLIDNGPGINRVNGNKVLLVIRVESTDSSSSLSQDELIKKIFTDEITVVKQFKSCSRGKFILNPANGPTIKNGVATIQLNQSIKGKKTHDVYAEIEKKGYGQFGRDLKDFSHVMICMPKGTIVGDKEFG